GAAAFQPRTRSARLPRRPLCANDRPILSRPQRSRSQPGIALQPANQGRRSSPPTWKGKPALLRRRTAPAVGSAATWRRRRFSPAPRLFTPGAFMSLERFVHTLLAFLLTAVMTTAAVAVDLLPREVFFGNPERANVQLSPDGKRLSFLAPSAGVLNVWVQTI